MRSWHTNEPRYGQLRRRRQQRSHAAIERAGLPNPGKSACFFCPASKKHEIRELAKLYPELADRAIAMEDNAALDTVKGLGRSFAWLTLRKVGCSPR